MDDLAQVLCYSSFPNGRHSWRPSQRYPVHIRLWKNHRNQQEDWNPVTSRAISSSDGCQHCSANSCKLHPGHARSVQVWSEILEGFTYQHLNITVFSSNLSIYTSSNGNSTAHPVSQILDQKRSRKFWNWRTGGKESSINDVTKRGWGVVFLWHRYIRHI